MAAGLIRYNLGEKRIVREAYESERAIRATARLYNITPSQIRRWKDRLQNVEAGLSRKLYRPPGFQVRDHDVYNHLLEFFENLRNQGRAVSITMLCNEARRLIWLRSSIGF